MKRIYYKKDTGYICHRAPLDLIADENDPYIEVDYDLYQLTFGVGTGKSWAVIDNELKEVIIPEYANDVIREDLTQQITDYKYYLNSTDYVITKLHEASLDSDEEYSLQLKAQYAEVLQLRKEARAKISTLTEELNNLDK